MSASLVAVLGELEHRLDGMVGLLRGSDPDPERVLEAVAALPALPSPAGAEGLEEGAGPVLERCRALHAEALALATAHRARLGAALVQLDRAAAGIRCYGAQPASPPRFIDCRE